jgi:hypothetical protein
MTQQPTSAPRWNLFARELEDILTDHGLRLEHLDDRVGIHREKVRRLIHSLRTPQSFPVLDPDEMEQVQQAFLLSDEEFLRLRAALLATSIEKTLMDRISQDDALLAAEQIYSLILKSMQTHVGGVSGLGIVKGGDSESDMDETLDMTMEFAKKMIDDADMALQLSQYVSSHRERLEKAQEALSTFAKARAVLEELGGDIHTLHVWQSWYTIAQQGFVNATKRLEDLGVE